MSVPLVRRPPVEFAFIVDPLDSLKAYKDSSVSMMRAAQARGHTLFALEPSDVFWEDGVTRARVQPLAVNDDQRPRDTIVLLIERIGAVNQRLRLLAEFDPFGAFGCCFCARHGVSRNAY